MIIDAIVNAVLGLLSVLIETLPEDPEPPDLSGYVTEAFDSMGSSWSFIADWFPISELGIALGVMLAWMVIVHGYRLLAWCLTFVHIGGTDA